MSLKKFVSAAALSVLLGAAAMVCAQDEPNDAKPRPEATKPPDEPRPSRREEAKPRPDEAKPQKEEKREQEKPSTKERADQSEHHEQHAARQRGARIPDDKFREHFGRQHTFVVNRVTVIENQPRFQYGDFWFGLVDVWPGDWAYTDDCYIDFVDGEYFLFDLRHPGVRIAVFVVS